MHTLSWKGSDRKSKLFNTLTRNVNKTPVKTAGKPQALLLITSAFVSRCQKILR